MEAGEKGGEWESEGTAQSKERGRGGSEGTDCVGGAMGRETKEALGLNDTAEGRGCGPREGHIFNGRARQRGCVAPNLPNDWTRARPIRNRSMRCSMIGQEKRALFLDWDSSAHQQPRAHGTLCRSCRGAGTYVPLSDRPLPLGPHRSPHPVPSFSYLALSPVHPSLPRPFRPPPPLPPPSPRLPRHFPSYTALPLTHTLTSEPYARF